MSSLKYSICMVGDLQKAIALLTRLWAVVFLLSVSTVILLRRKVNILRRNTSDIYQKKL
ncbi:hypothetical protein [uncultured Nostoc sp.]|uniref:hypothetical protein n=1 Tax=uncultured Nostoc sp. TaxID=340711 RepID=UPI0035C9B0FC